MDLHIPWTEGKSAAATLNRAELCARSKLVRGRHTWHWCQMWLPIGYTKHKRETKSPSSQNFFRCRITTAAGTAAKFTHVLSRTSHRRWSQNSRHRTGDAHPPPLKSGHLAKNHIFCNHLRHFWTKSPKWLFNFFSPARRTSWRAVAHYHTRSTLKILFKWPRPAVPLDIADTANGYSIWPWEKCSRGYPLYR